MDNVKVVYHASTATIGVAGILHLLMVPMAWERFLPAAMLFLVSGIAQLFWIVPSLKRWSSYWLYIGIGGNATLITLWTATRFPNPITERALPINEFGIITQVMQVAYIGLAAYALNLRRMEKRPAEGKNKDMMEKRGSPI